jgi:hypothetical protein
LIIDLLAAGRRTRRSYVLSTLRAPRSTGCHAE